jgi:hypothetical protein
MDSQTISNLISNNYYDLSFTRKTKEERAKEEQLYPDGTIKKVFIGDTEIGYGIFHNYPACYNGSHWNGYFKAEPTYHYPFDDEDEITKVTFLGCPLQEITYGYEKIIGFDHAHAEDNDQNYWMKQPVEHFYANWECVEKEIIAMYLFLNYASRNNLKRKPEEDIGNEPKKIVSE